jgi:hypothetical protein
MKCELDVGDVVHLPSDEDERMTVTAVTELEVDVVWIGADHQLLHARLPVKAVKLDHME